jgi:hypothetical protein
VSAAYGRSGDVVDCCSCKGASPEGECQNRSDEFDS